MAKVTSKLQVTVPKAVADRVGLRPGDDITWEIEGDVMRVRKGAELPPLTVAERLALFDEATARQRAREAATLQGRGRKSVPAHRGWTREELYERGRAR